MVNTVQMGIFLKKTVKEDQSRWYLASRCCRSDNAGLKQKARRGGKKKIQIIDLVISIKIKSHGFGNEHSKNVPFSDFHSL